MNQTRQLFLPADPTSVRQARRFARDAVIEWGLDELADDVQLGVSELVTNAVRHARTEVVMTIRFSGKLSVEVRDRDPELRHPSAAAVDPVAPSGRGLRIVSAVSADWGVRSVPDGKVVWFALALPDDDVMDADMYERRDHLRDHLEDARRLG